MAKSLSVAYLPRTMGHSLYSALPAACLRKHPLLNINMKYPLSSHAVILSLFGDLSFPTLPRTMDHLTTSYLVSAQHSSQLYQTNQPQPQIITIKKYSCPEMCQAHFYSKTFSFQLSLAVIRPSFKLYYQPSPDTFLLPNICCKNEPYAPLL